MGMTYEPYTNKDRVQAVEQAILSFAEEMGLDPDMDADGPVTVAGDMIANILHWVQQQDSRISALKAAKSGIGNYVTEQYIDYNADEVDELGPQSSVCITVLCNDQVWESNTYDRTKIFDAEDNEIEGEE